MRPGQVLLAIQPKLMSDALREAIDREVGLKVVDQVNDPIDLLTAVGEKNANVVVHNWPNNEEMPAICTHLFAEYPEVSFIGVSPDGHRGCVYRQTISKIPFAAKSLLDLVTAIRSTLFEDPEA